MRQIIHIQILEWLRGRYLKKSGTRNKQFKRFIFIKNEL